MPRYKIQYSGTFATKFLQIEFYFWTRTFRSTCGYFRISANFRLTKAMSFVKLVWRSKYHCSEQLPQLFGKVFLSICAGRNRVAFGCAIHYWNPPAKDHCLAPVRSEEGTDHGSNGHGRGAMREANHCRAHRSRVFCMVAGKFISLNNFASHRMS